jgi:hypothetical protein
MSYAVQFASRFRTTSSASCAAAEESSGLVVLKDSCCFAEVKEIEGSASLLESAKDANHAFVEDVGVANPATPSSAIRGSTAAKLVLDSEMSCAGDVLLGAVDIWLSAFNAAGALLCAEVVELDLAEVAGA